RRRHTRFSRDWSSDVCSSDLRKAEVELFERLDGRQRGKLRQGRALPLDLDVGFGREEPLEEGHESPVAAYGVPCDGRPAAVDARDRKSVGEGRSRGRRGGRRG